MTDIRRLWAREMAARGARDQHLRICRSRWPSTSKPLEKGAHHQTRRMAGNIGEQSLWDAFLDEDGKDVGYPPIELKNQCSADRAHLHQACDGSGLFYETAVTSNMAIGPRGIFRDSRG
jgi:hypothetical protein